MITEPVLVSPQDTPKPRRSRQSARPLSSAWRGAATNCEPRVFCAMPTQPDHTSAAAGAARTSSGQDRTVLAPEETAADRCRPAGPVGRAAGGPPGPRSAVTPGRFMPAESGPSGSPPFLRGQRVGFPGQRSQGGGDLVGGGADVGRGRARVAAAAAVGAAGVCLGDGVAEVPLTGRERITNHAEYL